MSSENYSQNGSVKDIEIFFERDSIVLSVQIENRNQSLKMDPAVASYVGMKLMQHARVLNSKFPEPPSSVFTFCGDPKVYS